MLKTTGLSPSQRDAALENEFLSVDSWEARYEKIISLGKSMQVLSEAEKVEDLKVRGCQSQVWLKADITESGEVILKADSDALITKGLIAMLLLYYSGLTPDQILTSPPTFIGKIGLSQHLSPSRSNGLSAMVKQIQFYALAYKMKSKD